MDERKDRPQAEDEAPDEGHDGGAYIGNRPEFASETIPGGVNDEDERVAGVDSQSSGEGKRDDRVQGRGDEWPGGHRDA